MSLAALSDRSYEGVRVADTALAVDAVGGTMGSTAVASALLNFDLGITTGRKPIFAAGSLYPVDYAEGRWGTSLKTSLRFITASKAYVDATLGDATLQKQIELKATSGSHIAKLQTAVFMDGDYELWGIQDDELTVDLNWKGVYNTTFGNYLKASLLNAVSALV